ncbi:MAG: CRISPR-associated endonuclease Cas1 [Myxococcota bacterium]
MSLLALIEQDCELSARGSSIVVLRRGIVTRTVPAHEVDEVHLYGGADLTIAGRNFLLARNIDTLFLTLDGRVRGRLVGWESPQADRRVEQYRLLCDGARALVLGRSFIARKLENQRSLLLLRQRHLRDEGIADTLAWLRGARTRLETAPDLDTVRGIEGMAAQRYFGCFAALLTNPAFTWTGRNRRPPRDPVNACLSYGYTLLCARAEQAIRTAGLDPSLGIVHGLSRGSPSFALDFAEAFRPLVDNFVLTLLNRRQLGPEDFAPPEAGRDVNDEGEVEPGATYLGPVGRKVFLRAWSRRLSERSHHPVLEGDWTLAGLFPSQAQQLRRVVEGEASAFVPAAVG